MTLPEDWVRFAKRRKYPWWSGVAVVFFGGQGIWEAAIDGNAWKALISGFVVGGLVSAIEQWRRLRKLLREAGG